MQTKAIIIKKENTNEYDQWVTCYTEEFGKLKTVAKSVLKPSSIQSLHLDIFNLAEFELINGRGMPIITGAQAIETFGGIKSSLAKTAVAYFFAEAVDKMVFENDKDDKLWNFLVEFLRELDKDSYNGLTIVQWSDHCRVISMFRRGQSRLLDILGYFPETDICRSCEDKLDENNFGAFNHILGGVVCKRCFLSGHGGILISREDFELLRSDLNNITENTAERLYWSDQYSTGQTSKAISAAGNGTEGQERNGTATQRTSISAAGRSVLDGMFEYISGSKFSSLELLNMVRYK